MNTRTILTASALLALAGGCDDEPPRERPAVPRGSAPETSPDMPSQDDLDQLRNLPYAGSTRVDPGATTGVVLHDSQRSSPGYTLYTLQMLASAQLVDMDGRLIRSWHDPSASGWERAELLANGDLLVVGIQRSNPPVAHIPDDQRHLARFDRDSRLQWKRQLTAHHDVEQTPDGKLLTLSFKRRLVPEMHADVPLRDDHLTLLDPQGLVIEEVSLLDAFRKRPDLHELEMLTPTDLGGAPYVDLFHSNSAERMHRPELVDRHPLFALDNVLICLRHQDVVAVISWRSRELVWAWGRGELLGPHDAQVLPDGHLLIFDNGLGRRWSRVIELDPVDRRIVWEYRAPDPHTFYTMGKGSAQRLPNGNTLIAQSDSGRLFEVTRGGDIVWEFLVPEEVAPGQRASTIRAIRHDEAFARRAGLLR